MKQIAASALILVSGPALAHDTWLLPTRFRIEPGGMLELHLTSAMEFPNPESPVKSDRLAEAKVRLAGVALLVAAREGEKVLALSARIAEPGVAVAWVSTRERSLQLSADQVAHYLDEVGAAETIGQQWKKAGQKPWRETYVKRAKAFVRVGEGGGDFWRQPIGLDLEIVPESDPTLLSVGDTLRLRLLWHGQALSGLAVGAVGAAPAKPALAMTDAEGRVSFVLSKAGAWLVRATRIVPSPARPGEWDSVFTTLVVEAKGR